jgi:glycosyltransferase involved in cell wall biosynthesis
MRVIVASAVAPFVPGGATLLHEWLTAELRARGHEVESISLPFLSVPTEMPRQMVGLRLIDVRDRGDVLIALRYPAHLLRHPRKSVWFLHHHRPAFDLWGTEYQDIPNTEEGVGLREMLRSADNVGLSEATGLFCNSAVMRHRIQKFNGLEAEVLLPPLHQPERYRPEQYGDAVVAVARVGAHKRQRLLVQAMEHVRTPVRLVVAGRADSASTADELHRLASAPGIEGRVELRLGHIAENEKVSLINRALAVAYIPVDEDSYGYPSLEAHHAARAVVTCSDSGGTLELVENERNGEVVEPDPRALAAAFDRLWEDRARAQRMGEAGMKRLEELNINWDHVVGRLLQCG